MTEQIGLQAVLDDKDFQDGLKRYNSGVSHLTSITEGAAKIMTGAFVVGTAAATAALGAFTLAAKTGLQTTLDLGESLDKLVDMFGMSGEEAAKWSTAFSRVGVPIEEGAQQLNYFTRQLDTLSDTSKKGVAVVTPFGTALEKLGVKAKDAQGKTRTFNDILPDIMDKFNKLPAGVNSTALAMDLFGARGGSKFLDFLRLGKAGLADADAFAKEFGLTLTTDGVTAVEEFGFRMNDLNLAVKGIWNSLGKELLPVARQLVDYIITNVLPVFSKWAKDNAPQVTIAIREIGKWINNEVIPRLVSLKAWFDVNWPIIAKTIVNAWNNDIKPALDAFKAWLESDGLAALTVFFNKLQEFQPLVADWKQAWQDMADFTAKMTGAINEDAGVKFPTLADIIGGAMDLIKYRMGQPLETIKSMQKAFNQVITGDWRSLVYTIGEEIIPDFFTNLMGNSIGVNFREILQRFRNLWFAIGQDLRELAPNVIAGVNELMQNIWSTIVNWGDSLRNALTQPFSDASQRIRDLLGMHSPSKVFEDIGRNMLAGLQQGFGTPQLNAVMAGSMSNVSAARFPVYTSNSSSVNSVTNAGTSRSFTFNINGPINGVGDLRREIWTAIDMHERGLD
jgi:TP901 family phage tail tape measure protein